MMSNHQKRHIQSPLESVCAIWPGLRHDLTSSRAVCSASHHISSEAAALCISPEFTRSKQQASQLSTTNQTSWAHHAKPQTHKSSEASCFTRWSVHSAKKCPVSNLRRGRRSHPGRRVKHNSRSAAEFTAVAVMTGRFR